ncbi:UDP-N-acetylmuramate dehydrogenase [Desulfothermus okinawensis JCM 13304]
MKIISRPSLDKLTTVGITSRCEGLIEVRDVKDLEETSNFFKKKGVRGIFLGNGSNVVPGSNFLDLFLVRLFNNKLDIVKEDKDHLIIEVGGGVPLKTLIMWAVKRGYMGLENLIGIPGTVGGAVCMNAGSYGTEIFDAISKLTLWHEDKGLVTYVKDELDFSYRKFISPFPKGLWCVFSTTISFKKSDKNLLLSKIKETFIKKKNTQPITSKTCGCVFKNPIQYPAGYLLDKSGMKGFSVGDIMFSNIHANFLINRGKGTPSQVMEIIEIAKTKVFENFGINLDLEVKILS